MNELKIFTLDEANQLLPVLIELLGALHAKQREAAEVEIKIDALELVATAQDDATRQELNQQIEHHRQLAVDFYAVVDQIHEHGCFLKDAELGLIDFYGTVQGRVVYLCWRLGEDQIRFWHEIGEGYMSRQALSLDQP